MRPPRRRALLIGINYIAKNYGPPHKIPRELFGCIDDAQSIAKFLLTQGWKAEDICVMSDDQKGSFMPTKENCLENLRWLVSGARPGDILFFSYSGHGSQRVDPNGIEEDGMNEVIMPADYPTKGIITDDELNEIAIRPLPNGCKLIGLVDACHSGTIFDLPFQWCHGKWREDVNPMHTVGDVTMISGCKDSEISADEDDGGAMTNSFLRIVKNSSNLTYNQLFTDLHKDLRAHGFNQRPILTSSQRFPPDRPFSFDHIIANSNESIGQTIRKTFTRAMYQKSKATEKRTRVILWFVIAAVIGFGLVAAIGFASGMDLTLIMIIAGVIALVFGCLTAFLCSPSCWPAVRLKLLRLQDKLKSPVSYKGKVPDNTSPTFAAE